MCSRSIIGYCRRRVDFIRSSLCSCGPPLRYTSIFFRLWFLLLGAQSHGYRQSLQPPFQCLSVLIFILCIGGVISCLCLKITNEFAERNKDSSRRLAICGSFCIHSTGAFGLRAWSNRALCSTKVVTVL